jgi:hypothetical protein
MKIATAFALLTAFAQASPLEAAAPVAAPAALAAAPVAAPAAPIAAPAAPAAPAPNDYYHDNACRVVQPVHCRYGPGTNFPDAPTHPRIYPGEVFGVACTAVGETINGES